MTCIVAVEDESGVVMGADRAAANEAQIDTLEQAKVFENGPALIGCCGSFRMAQLLRHALVVPKLRRSADVDAWVTVELMSAVIETFQDHGWSKVELGVSSGGTWLLSVRGRCYEVQDDYSAIRSAGGEYAIGAGVQFAAGSLHTSRSTLSRTSGRVGLALEAAAHCSPTVQGPFDILTQEKTR